MAKTPNTKEVSTVFPGVGGSYAVDPETGALTLTEPATRDSEADEPAPLAPPVPADPIPVIELQEASS